VTDVGYSGTQVRAAGLPRWLAARARVGGALAGQGAEEALPAFDQRIDEVEDVVDDGLRRFAALDQFAELLQGDGGVEPGGRDEGLELPGLQHLPSGLEDV